MNVASIAFLFMFAVLGGGIAYFADRLGRTLGKKRLSLLGLRPRHTAELLTVGAGAIVPILTVLLVMALSAGVREWLINGPKLLQERDDSYKQRAKLMLENSDLIKSADSLKTDNAKLITNNEQLSTTQNVLRGKVNETNNQLKSKSSELQAKTAQLTQSTAQLNTARQQYSVVHNQLSVVQSQMTVVRKDLDASNKQLEEKRGDLTKLQDKVRALNASYSTLQKNYALLKIDEGKAVEDVQKANSEIAILEPKITELDAAIRGKQTELDQTNKELNLANRQRDFAAGLFDRTRKVPVNFSVNDELAREFVPSGTNITEARSIVVRLIQTASALAKQRGAADNGRGLEAGLVDLPTGVGNEVITADREQEEAVNQIANSKEPLLLVARAFYNTVEGEFVPLNVSVYRNPLVYHRNEPIAETYVQGSLSDQQIFQQIADFISNKVRTRLKNDKKMIAVTGGDETYGEIPQGEVYSLVEKIHTWGKSARLIAMASQDTYAGDSLVLKFDLRQ